MNAFIEADASGLVPSNAPFANIQYRLSCEDSTVPLMTSIASKQDGGLMHEMLEGWKLRPVRLCREECLIAQADQLKQHDLLCINTAYQIAMVISAKRTGQCGEHPGTLR
jgi:hypothetical protein